jgi:hypothetical protein
MRTEERAGPMPASYLLLLVAGAVLLAWRASKFFAAVQARVGYPYELDYTEGSVLCQIRDFVGGVPLYGRLGERPYTFTVYPPLYHVVAAALGSGLEDTVAAGRLLSLASAAALALVIGGLVHRMGAGAAGPVRWAATVLAVVSFLTTEHVFQASTMMRVDMLAMSLSLLGLYVFLRSPSAAGRGVALLAFTLALLAKQSVIAAPLACILGTAIVRPRSGLKIGLAFVLLVSVAFAVLRMIFGDTIFFHLFQANVVSYDPLQAVTDIVRFVIRYPVLVTAGVAAFLHLVLRTLKDARRSSIDTWTLVVYFVLASASLLSTGRVGTHTNHLIEATVALSVFGGLAVLWAGSHVRQRPASSIWTAVAMAAPLALALQAAQNTRTLRLPSYRPDALQVRETLLDRIRATPGPVFGDSQFLVCKAGKPAQINTFMVAQLAIVGGWDAGPFLDDIRREAFALVILPFDLIGERYEGVFFTPEAIAALREHYRLDERIDKYRVYRPAGARGEVLTRAAGRRA